VLYAIARPSVRPSVCLSVTRVDQSEMVQVRITQPSPQSSPMTLSFLTLDLAAKFQRGDRERWHRIRRVWKIRTLYGGEYCITIHQGAPLSYDICTCLLAGYCIMIHQAAPVARW